MPTKRRSSSSVVLLVPLMVFASACTAPPDQSIVVSAARAAGTQCDFSDATKYVEGGAIDLAAYGAASSYYQIFGWENDLQNIGVTVGGDQITTQTPNTFIATTIKDSYVLLNGTNPPSGLVSISASIAPGALPTNNTVGVYLLTQAAAQAICGAPTPGGENCPGLPAGSASQTLLVTFQILGSLVGGAAAQTNPITFPLTLFNGGNVAAPNIGVGLGTCTGTAVPQTTTCLIPGRDIPYCVVPPP